MFDVFDSGSTDDLEAFLNNAINGEIYRRLERFGSEGVAALQSATPKESGETAASWYYEIKNDGKTWSIIWGNSHMAGDTPVAVLLDLGHGTGTGGYVEGRDFINPTMQPIFDRMAEEAWKAVTG